MKFALPIFRYRERNIISAGNIAAGYAVDNVKNGDVILVYGLFSLPTHHFPHLQHIQVWYPMPSWKRISKENSLELLLLIPTLNLKGKHYYENLWMKARVSARHSRLTSRNPLYLLLPHFHPLCSARSQQGFLRSTCTFFKWGRNFASRDCCCCHDGIFNGNSRPRTGRDVQVSSTGSVGCYYV